MTTFDTNKVLQYTISLQAEILRLEQERDEWRNVADLLAAEIDEATYDLGDSDALIKFKALEKKYPL